MLKHLYFALLVALSLPAIAAEDTAVLSSYEAFVAQFRTATSARQLQPWLAQGSPLYRALSEKEADAALEQYQQMLARFEQHELSVEIQDGSAEVVALGKTPVSNPQLLRYIQVANATFRVSLQREDNGWKVADTSYKVRYSD